MMDETKGQTNYEFFHRRLVPGDRGPTTADRMGRFERHAGVIAVRSSKDALERAGVEKSEITHLITVSCTGFYAPGIDFDIVNGLGLSRDVERVQIGFMGCHATLNAIRVASALAEKNRRARVLITSVELCSLHFQYGWDSDQVVSNSLFADGSGALVGCYAEAPGEAPRAWTVVLNGSRLVPDSADAMTWRIGDTGFEMFLDVSVHPLLMLPL